MAFDVDMKLNENDFFFFTKLWGVHNNLMWHVIIGYNLSNFFLFLER